MEKTIRIALNESELNNLKLIAHNRHDLKDKIYNNSNRYGFSQNMDERDYLGILGEFAVSKYLKIPFDYTINLDGDGGHVDMFLGDWSLQVKSTKYKQGRVMFNSIKEVEALINVLCYVDIDNNLVEILGYITRKDFIKNNYIKQFGKKSTYCVDQQLLRSISEVKFYYLLENYNLNDYGKYFEEKPIY